MKKLVAFLFGLGSLVAISVSANAVVQDPAAPDNQEWVQTAPCNDDNVCNQLPVAQQVPVCNTDTVCNPVPCDQPCNPAPCNPGC